MFKVVDFHESHAQNLLKEPINSNIAAECSGGYLKALAVQTYSKTFLVGEEVVCVGGVTRLWGRRGYLWMILSENIKRHPVSTYRGLRKYLSSLPYDRIEMDVPCGTLFDARRARFMGFKLEVPYARSYSPTGEDRAIYAWVRG